MDPKGKRALEVGCGGGILSEEIARMGFDTTGIDPSEQSLRIAADHARAGGLEISYEKGTGEAIAYENGCFDAVFCCDVLEHVADLPKVICEIGRVLRPGGIFCYDTFNRTFISRLAVIDIAQRWKRWALMPPNFHVWEMFIRPRELKSLLRQYDLEWREHRGVGLNVSVVEALRYLRKRAAGELNYRDLGEKLLLCESKCMSVMYMGYAIKNPPAAEFQRQVSSNRRFYETKKQ